MAIVPKGLIIKHRAKCYMNDLEQTFNVTKPYELTDSHINATLAVIP